MLKVGDTIQYNGVDAKVTEVQDSNFVVYVTDKSGGYHTTIKLPELESYKKIQEVLGAFEEQSETAAKPKRYNNGSIEVWDAIDQLGFDYFQGAITKYIARYKDKNGPEDLLKAINYCIKLIANETKIDYYELHKLSPEELAKRIKK
jgi:hypothetical protein